MQLNCPVYDIVFGTNRHVFYTELYDEQYQKSIKTTTETDNFSGGFEYQF